MVLLLQLIFSSCKFRFKRYTNFYYRIVCHFHFYLLSDDQLGAEDGQKKLSEYMTRFHFYPPNSSGSCWVLTFSLCVPAQ